MSASSATTPLLFVEFHSSPIGGHQGALKTYQRLAREVCWQGMTRRVQAFEVDCSMSAGEELNFVSSRALASVTNSQQSMGRYSDEFCGRIAKVERYDTVMVV